jgi:hypothetical protein
MIIKLGAQHLLAGANMLMLSIASSSFLSHDFAAPSMRLLLSATAA